MENVTIESDKIYSPREIARLGLIKNNRGNPHDYNFVLRLIHKELLKAQNMNPDGASYFRVKGQDILDFLNS